MLIVWVVSRIGLHALMLIKHIIVLMLPSAAAQFPLVSVLAPVSLRTQSALIGQLAHA